ncbi:metaxin-1-like [Xenia sp. Carnegie-2017]|uniref:metaxin-1-like n=1 Tax=Xenia sp. Carnegie-2017 TaxID=2897299 RepID=UPI001F039AEB|nr:metaxin-1-like [Xenia sp. Carnegie-2017]
MADVANLMVWTGGWGLPSLDPCCLQVMTYLKFAAFPVNLIRTDNPYKSPTGTLPVLKLTDDIVCGYDDINEYLKQNHNDIDGKLSSEQKLNTLGLGCYVEDALRPALLYMTWLTEENYPQFTRSWYARQLKFPYKYFVPAKYYNHALNFVAHKLNLEESDVISDVTWEKLRKRVDSCLEILNDILGDQNFLFGDRPTTLDAKVFAYLAIMLKIPLPKNKLKSQILEYPKLEKYCDKIVQRFFPEVPQDLAPANKALDEAAESRRTKINAALSIGFALVSMLFYSLSSGIISLEVKEKESRDNSHVQHNIKSRGP